MYEIPIIEKLNTPCFVEELLDNEQAVHKALLRIQDAKNIEEYLTASEPTQEQFQAYCDSLANILDESPRIALYVPLEELNLDTAPHRLRAAYHRAWRKCWNYTEIRSDYTQGDIDPNLSIREGQAIVKAFHLLPWLIRGGIVQPITIDEIIENFTDNTAAMQSLSDCLQVFEDEEFFKNSLGHCSKNRITEIKSLRPPQPKLFEDEEDEDESDRWKFKRLVMCTHNRSRLRNVTGPFSANVRDIQNKICVIENTINVDEVILVGGSRLKGYATYASDFDAYSYDPPTRKLIDLKPNMSMNAQIPNPAVTHMCFDTIWVGVDSKMVRESQIDCMNCYLSLPAESPERAQALKTLENDLLKFRLMHKGFPYSHTQLSEESRHYSDIDGNSAFYDRRYRIAATCLFAKYVQIPQI